MPLHIVELLWFFFPTVIWTFLSILSAWCMFFPELSQGSLQYTNLTKLSYTCIYNWYRCHGGVLNHRIGTDTQHWYWCVPSWKCMLQLQWDIELLACHTLLGTNHKNVVSGWGLQLISTKIQQRVPLPPSKVPGAPPRRVEVEVLNSTALKVMWRSLTPGKQNGQIRGYQVHYVRVENGESRGLPLIKDVMLADAQVWPSHASF